MIHGLETSIAAIIAHFVAFGLFNIIAILSKSIVDYVHLRRVSGKKWEQKYTLKK